MSAIPSELLSAMRFVLQLLQSEIIAHLTYIAEGSH
jgi:hypothetical protein